MTAPYDQQIDGDAARGCLWGCVLGLLVWLTAVAVWWLL